MPGELPSSTDAAVIGGGVVGLACALELARRGLAVCVLERGQVGHGCSYGNAGWLTPSLAMPLAVPGQWRKVARWLLDPESPFYIRPRPDPALVTWLIRFVGASGSRRRFARNGAALVELCRHSVDSWERLAAEPDSPPFGFARDGLLAVHEDADALQATLRSAEWTATLGVPFESWSAEEVRDREPALRGDVVGGVFFPREARCEPYPAVGALAAAAERVGVTLVEGAEVTGAERDGNELRTLATTRGRLEAREIVLAAGAWSGLLGRQLGVRLPMLGAKGYSVVASRKEPHPTRSLYLAERKVAINPHADSLRVSGTLELVGLDLSINTRRVDAVVRGARGLLDFGETPAPAEAWSGLRPCLPDGMPVIGRSRGTRNLWLATGHQMTGLKTAPGSGRLLAELVCGQPPSFDPAPFRPDRYGGS
jgi:D-amino-acid dehydrogenase